MRKMINSIVEGYEAVVKDPVAEFVHKYDYLVDSIAKGLIKDRKYLSLDDLKQQGRLIILETINKRLIPTSFIDEKEIVGILVELLTKELSTYIKNIDNYMSRKVRCNSTSKESEKRCNKLFEDCESLINKDTLYNIMYPSGECNKYDIAANAVMYLMNLGICPINVPADFIVTDEDEANKILELIADYLL